MTDLGLTFRCNLCGHVNTQPPDAFDRERGTCSKCRSGVRIRSIIHTLSMGLFGESHVIDEFPKSDAKGLGLSDWGPYAKRLAKKLDYTNTYFDGEPFLDITQPGEEHWGQYDFMIATDVFEHVVPPVEKAFEGARKVLKPDGFFVFSVPYSLLPETKEHFPDLHEWTIEDRKGDNPKLINTTREGERQEFSDLVFHGGRGATLEMRVFSLEGLKQVLANTGWQPPHIHTACHLKHGVVWNVEWSLTMTLRPAP